MKVKSSLTRKSDYNIITAKEYAEMRRRIVPIGNSRGLRIPKAILEQCRIEDEVELRTEGDRIIISPVKKSPRQGWDQAFKRMREVGEDRLLFDERVDADFKDWEW